VSDPVFVAVLLAACLAAAAFAVIPLLRQRGGVALIVAIALAIPLATIVLYRLVGTPAAIDPDTGQIGDIRASLVDLSGDALREPDNAEHWARLGLAYKSLEEFDSAEHAFRRALFLEEHNDFLQVELSEILLYASGQPRLPDEARSLLIDAVTTNPANQKGLWLLGIDALGRDDNDSAVVWLEQLLSVLPEQAEVRASVGEYLARARAGRGNPMPDNASADEALLTVNVSLAGELAGQVDSMTALYVFIRPAGQPAAPPLAVRRLAPDALPASVAIRAGDTMTAGDRLVDGTRVDVTARLSLSGDARPAVGDIQGQTRSVELGPAATTEVTIRERLD